MPVKLGPRHPEGLEARIEIIPLIDIMFFLLAAFMLVSLSMVHRRSLPVNLPSAATASPDDARSILELTVDKAGVAYLEAKPVGDNELLQTLVAARSTNDAVRVSISGDQDARHGDVVRVLDLVRSTGIQKVTFEIRPKATAGAPP